MERHGENGLVVGDAPTAWHDSLKQLLEGNAAKAGQAALDTQRVDDPLNAVSFWQAHSRYHYAVENTQ